MLPASLWDESGRYESVGSELMRFTDRNNARLVLGMTHEERRCSLFASMQIHIPNTRS